MDHVELSFGQREAREGGAERVLDGGGAQPPREGRELGGHLLPTPRSVQARAAVQRRHTERCRGQNIAH